MYKILTGDLNAEADVKKTKCLSTHGVDWTAPLGWKDGKTIHEKLVGVQVVSTFGSPMRTIHTDNVQPDALKGIGVNYAADPDGFIVSISHYHPATSFVKG